VEDARIVIPDNKDIKFTISVGISQVSKNDIKIESTLKRADEALYEAKTSGKNQTRFNI
jgi:diguanylate cyclase (GGDEF)-like protein